MAKKKTNNIKNLYIVIAVIALMIVLITVIAVVISQNKKSQTQKNSSTQNSETEEPEMTQEEEIRTLSESARMKRYVGIFFENIENGDYQASYNVLNQEFKDRYFPTLEDFQEYANKYFDPMLIGIKYDNIERLGNNKTGNMYVLWLTIGSIYQGKLEEDEKLDQTNFVIIERDYNNYEMSFSVNLESEE